MLIPPNVVDLLKRRCKEIKRDETQTLHGRRQKAAIKSTIPLRYCALRSVKLAYQLKYRRELPECERRGAI